METETTSLLPHNWEVPQVFRQRLGTSVGRQRLMQADGHLLLVLHVPPEPNQPNRVGRFFWRDSKGQWFSSDFGRGPEAMQRHLGEYSERISELDSLEDRAQTAQQYFAVLEHLAPLQRSVKNLHSVLQEARQAAAADRGLIDARDRAYDLERTADLVYANARHGLEYSMLKRAEQQATSSRRMAVAAHRLNLLAAFFFPLATISAVFGANLLHGLEEAPPPWALVAVVAAGLLIGWIIAGYVGRAPQEAEAPDKHGTSRQAAPSRAVSDTALPRKSYAGKSSDRLRGM